MTDRLTDQQLVVHAFAPTEGPYALPALAQMRAIWTRCGELLGTTVPIAGLPATFPTDVESAAAQPTLAALEDRAALHQVIVRRADDVLNLSVALTAAQENATRRRRLGSAAPPGWVEFNRWWDEIAAGGTEAFLGVTQLYLAAAAGKGTNPPVDAVGEVRAALPATQQAPFWWDHGQVFLREFVVWEWSPSHDARGERRLAIVCPAGRDPQLSVWTWSDGGPAMPPLARYLMHAAKVRYQGRVWAGGKDVDRLRQRVNACVDDLRQVLDAEAALSEQMAADRRLQAEEMNVAATVSDMGEMQHTLEIAKSNMDKAMTEPLRSDLVLAGELSQSLADAAVYLDKVRQLATDIGRAARRHWPTTATPKPAAGDVAQLSALRTSAPTQRADLDRPAAWTDADRDPLHRPVTVRMGYGIDIVNYSARSGWARDDAQNRLAALNRDVLTKLAIQVQDTDHQGTGDGMNVFLPPTLEIHRALPRLLRSWREGLHRDNQRYRDRLRLRLAAGVGPAGVAALGFAGNTIVEVNRLLNSKALRQAMVDHPDIGLSALIADQLYQWVISAGAPELNPAEFSQVNVKVKTFTGKAWLWIPK